MPAPVAPLLGFALGALFAWAAGDELSRSPGSAVMSRCLLLVAIFSIVVFAPVTAYFVSFAADWSFAYLVDTERIPGAVDLALVLVTVASVPLGFTVAARSPSVGRVGRLARVAGAPALLSAAFLIVAGPRLALHASYAQFHGDFGVSSVAGSPLGYALLWMDGVLLAGVLLTARAIRRIGEETRRDSPRRGDE